MISEKTAGEPIQPPVVASHRAGLSDLDDGAVLFAVANGLVLVRAWVRDGAITRICPAAYDRRCTEYRHPTARSWSGGVDTDRRCGLVRTNSAAIRLLDEMVARIAGKRMYLWRAVDHEGGSSTGWSRVAATAERRCS